MGACGLDLFGKQTQPNLAGATNHCHCTRPGHRTSLIAQVHKSLVLLPKIQILTPDSGVMYPVLNGMDSFAGLVKVRFAVAFHALFCLYFPRDK